KNTDFLSLTQLATDNSDGIIIGCEKIDDKVRKHLAGMDKPLLDYQGDENYIDAYNDFYDKLLQDSKK
ncbi:MAG: glycogen synthase, partial [Bacteroidales bacterium]|nr:glycogen synthase [Bacteroidales bacterium]